MNVLLHISFLLLMDLLFYLFLLAEEFNYDYCPHKAVLEMDPVMYPEQAKDQVIPQKATIWQNLPEHTHQENTFGSTLKPNNDLFTVFCPRSCWMPPYCPELPIWPKIENPYWKLGWGTLWSSYFVLHIWEHVKN